MLKNVFTFNVVHSDPVQLHRNIIHYGADSKSRARHSVEYDPYISSTIEHLHTHIHTQEKSLFRKNNKKKSHMHNNTKTSKKFTYKIGFSYTLP